jgi:hypothetical protein
MEYEVNQSKKKKKKNYASYVYILKLSNIKKLYIVFLMESTLNIYSLNFFFFFLKYMKLDI